jgi:hypothetical protein
LILAKKVSLARANIGEEQLSVFKVFHSSFDYVCKQKCGASEKRNGNCHVFANSRWAILPFLLLTHGVIWTFPSGFPTLFKYCLEAIQ